MAQTRHPLHELHAFHQRMLDQCESLWRLVVHLGQCAPDAQSRRASEQLLAWFDHAGDAFTGEELLLYPALAKALAGAEAEEIHQLTAALARSHRAIEAGWMRLRGIVAAVAAGECRPEVIEAAGTFVRQVRHQVQNEQERLLPLAHELIHESDLSRIAQAVCARAQTSVSCPAVP